MLHKLLKPALHILHTSTLWLTFTFAFMLIAVNVPDTIRPTAYVIALVLSVLFTGVLFFIRKHHPLTMRSLLSISLSIISLFVFDRIQQKGWIFEIKNFTLDQIDYWLGHTTVNPTLANDIMISCNVLAVIAIFQFFCIVMLEKLEMAESKPEAEVESTHEEATC